jgi:hypothetical protein
VSLVDCNDNALSRYAKIIELFNIVQCIVLGNERLQPLAETMHSLKSPFNTGSGMSGRRIFNLGSALNSGVPVVSGGLCVSSRRFTTVSEKERNRFRWSRVFVIIAITLFNHCNSYEIL